MRKSKLTTTLAVLRVKHLDLTQRQMADLCGKSTHTIQSIELGRLNMSRELATVISDRTGVSIYWLHNNNVNAPIVTVANKKYNAEVFRKREDIRQNLKGKGSCLIRDNEAIVLVSRILAIVANGEAIRIGASVITQLHNFVQDLEKRHGTDQALQEKFEYMFDRIASCEDIFLMEEFKEAASAYRNLVKGQSIKDAQKVLNSLSPLLHALDFLIGGDPSVQVKSTWKEPKPECLLDKMIREKKISSHDALGMVIRNCFGKNAKNFKIKYLTPKLNPVLKKLG